MKKNVTDVLKELIPMAVDTIADYIDNKDSENSTIEENDQNYEVVESSPNYVESSLKEKFGNDEIEYIKDVHELAVGMIKYKPINMINDHMNERGLNEVEKIEEAYKNGFHDGFMLADGVHQSHMEFVFDRMTDRKEIIKTAKCFIGENYKDDEE